MILSKLFYIINRLQREKGLLYVSLGNFAANGIAAILWLLLARILDPQLYGEVNFYIAVGTFSSVIGLFGLNNVITTLTAKGSKEIRNEFLSFLVITNTAIGIALYTIFKMYSISLLSSGLALFLFSLAEVLGLQHYKQYSKLLILQRSSQFILAISLFYLIGAEGIVWGYAISSSIFGFQLFRNFRFTFNFAAIRQKNRFIFHSLSLEMARNIAVISDKLIIAPIFGYNVLGNYQIGAQLLVMLGVVPSIFYYYLLPRESRGINHDKILLRSILIGGALFVISFATLPMFINALFPNFVSSILASQIVCLGIVPLSASLVLSAKLIARENSVSIFHASIIFVSTQLVLFIILGRIGNIVGLSVATVLALVAEASYLFIRYRRG
jgi:O-antigen/teichoic acid export membrane protein